MWHCDAMPKYDDSLPSYTDLEMCPHPQGCICLFCKISNTILLGNTILTINNLKTPNKIILVVYLQHLACLVQLPSKF